MDKKINKKRLIGTFYDLVKIKSPSKNEKEIVDFVSKELEGLGLDVLIDDCGNKFGSNSGNIVAVLKNNNTVIKPAYFLSAHLDTVEVREEIIPYEKNGRIINKNSNTILGADDKVAVAAILEVLKTIIEKDVETHELWVLLTISEEIGLCGAKYMDTGNIKAKYGFAFDADGDIGTIINKAPYQDSIYTQITGKAAHAGIEPEKGISSIKVASEAIYNIKSGRIDADTTCNIGKIKGGVEKNIVPENTEVQSEARSLDEKKLVQVTKGIENCFIKAGDKYGADIKNNTVREYDGFEINEDELPVSVAKRSIEKIGRKVTIKSSGGGSDINIFNSKELCGVNLSSGMEKVHTKDEYVKISELCKLTELILEIVTA